MFPRSPACCRAVKRQLVQPSDSVWVSDEALRHAFQRFINSRLGKRYGSFIPGPLESRRRLGKRRMTHLSEYIPTSAHDSGSLWGFFGEVDNTKWHWEAPTTRNLAERSVAALPTWLVNWENAPEVVLESEAVEDPTKNLMEEASVIEEDILNFRRTLEAASPHEMLDICGTFNQRFKQSLRLGLVSEATIYSALNTVTRDIRIAFSESGLSDTHHLLSFYQALWEGVISCKVLGPIDLDAKVMNRFLLRLGNLPISKELQTLLHGVIFAASITQLSGMVRGLHRVVIAWARSWLCEQPHGDPQLSFLGAIQGFSESSKRLDRIQSLMHSREKDGQYNLSIIRKTVEEAKESLDSALNHIFQAEKILLPQNASIDTLASILGYLPRDFLFRLLDSCTQHVIRIHNSVENPGADLRHGWLSLVAKLPELPYKMFVQIVKQVEECNGPPERPLPADVVLSRWISQGYLREGALVRNASEVSALDSGFLDLGLLLFTIHQHREKMFCRTKDLFNLYNKLGRYTEVYGLLVQMQNLGLKLPPGVIGQTIEIMSKYDLRLAYRIHMMFYSGLRTDGESLRPELNPNFIISMVNHRRFTPLKIWKVMGIPFYEKMLVFERSRFSTKRLSPARIELVTKVAIAFAQTEAREQRQAFRNVVQCLHHLRRHNAPVTPELARAISHAGFTRKILAGQWISKELLNWVLGIIEVAEGTDVAVIADRAVTFWNEQLAELQNEKSRGERHEG